MRGREERGEGRRGGGDEGRVKDDHLDAVPINDSLSHRAHQLTIGIFVNHVGQNPFESTICYVPTLYCYILSCWWHMSSVSSFHILGKSGWAKVKLMIANNRGFDIQFVENRWHVLYVYVRK